MLNPYLTFNGNCKEAFQYYEQCLGGKIIAMMPHAGTPAEQHVPAAWLDKIMHARLDLGGVMLMGSDAPPDHYEAPKGFSVALQIKEPAEADRIYEALSKGGTVKMPIQKTFWAARFAMLIDQYGIPWMINCEQQAS
jgi:PhnB protein